MMFIITILNMTDNFWNIFCKVKVFNHVFGFGSIGLIFRPFSFEVNINVDIGGRRGCRGCSLPLAGLLAGKPCQLKVLSEALLLNRRVL